MPTLIPIDGAVEQTQEQTWPVMLSFTTLSQPAPVPARVGMTVLSQPLAKAGAARIGITVGDPAVEPALIGFELGTSSYPDNSLSMGYAQRGFDVAGPLLRSVMLSLTVSRSTPASAAPARLWLEVVSSNTLRPPVMIGLDVRGQIPGVPARLSFDIRTLPLTAAMLALETSRVMIVPVYSALDIGSEQVYVARLGLDVRGGESFMILADVYPENYPDSVEGLDGFYPSQQLRPRLLVNDVEVTLVDFTYERPKGRLGSTFNARVARFDTAGLDAQARIDFSLMIYNPDTLTEVEHPLIVNGRLIGREHGIAWLDRGSSRGPGDTVQISALDVVGDRFSIAPRQNITMYDPAIVKLPEVQTDHESSLRDELGQIIPQSLEPVEKLTMMKGLQRAYSTLNGVAFVSPAGLVTGGTTLASIQALGIGLGFSKIVTNIPDYAISRVDFTVEGGYHDGALPLVAMYGPIFFDLGNVLYIINLTNALPGGFTPKIVPISAYRQLTLIIPVKEYTNAVLLTYKANPDESSLENATFYTYLFEYPTPQETGHFGDPGYTRTEEEIKWRETRRILDPETVIAKIEESRKTSTFTVFVGGDLGGGAFLETHRETQQNFYDGTLKTGHFKTVMGIIASGPDASLALTTVLQEDCKVEWQATSDPDTSVQTRCTTRISGLIYTSTDMKRVKGQDGQMHDVPIRYPALAAQKNGIIQDDGRMGFAPIKVITETLNHTQGSQVDMMVKVVDLFTGTVENSLTQPRTGSRGTSDRQAKSRTILIRDLVSEGLIKPRKPFSVNAGELPLDRALALGHSVLKFLKNPRYEAKAALPGVDLTLDRGSVIIAGKRAGNTNPLMVTGLSIKGENLGQRGQLISMTLEGDEL